jgi:hypothetical protein
MLGGECGLIKNVKYECNDPNTECVQIDKSYSQFRCMKGYRTNPDTYECEKVENRMITSKCSLSNPCTDENSICSSKDGEVICICDYLNHYVMSNIQICQISYGFTSICSNSDDCSGGIYSCVDGVCLCLDGYKINENYTGCELIPFTEDTSYDDNNNSCYYLIRFLYFALLVLL